jgi:hypothetical protein
VELLCGVGQVRFEVAVIDVGNPRINHGIQPAPAEHDNVVLPEVFYNDKESLHEDERIGSRDDCL